jgi:primosomal protein N'
MPPILAIAVDAPLRRLFDYRPPAGTPDDALIPGMRLWVPFGRRRAVGVLVALRAHSDIPAAKLRSAIARIGSEPIFDQGLLELLVWAADYYRHPIGEVIAAALPGPLRAGADAEATTVRWALSVAARTGGLAPLSTRALRLREMVSALEGRRDAGEGDLAALSPRWREHLRELERRGWVVEVARYRTRAGTQFPAAERGHGDRTSGRPVPAVPAARHHRQRQDRGLPARDRAGGRTAAAGARPGARDRADAAARGPIHRAFPDTARGAAFLSH